MGPAALQNSRHAVEAHDLLDPKCPVALALLDSVEREVSAEGLAGESAFRATVARLTPRALEHKVSCARCHAFDPVRRHRRPDGSAIWGGGTIGTLLGLVAAFFTSYRFEAIVVGAIAGVLVGLVAHLAALVGQRIR